MTCSSSASDEIKKGVVRVAIDNWEGVTGDNAYRYEEDPTLDGIMPRLSFESYVDHTTHMPMSWTAS